MRIESLQPESMTECTQSNVTRADHVINLQAKVLITLAKVIVKINSGSVFVSTTQSFISRVNHLLITRLNTARSTDSVTRGVRDVRVNTVSFLNSIK